MSERAAPSHLVSASAVVTSTHIAEPGWLEITSGIISALGSGEPPRTPDESLATTIVVPGFVDIHVHGGGGHRFTSLQPSDVRAAVEFHRSRGTTTVVASLVSADEPTLTRSIDVLRELVEQGDLAGIHLEGPWLSQRRRGAHEANALRPPDQAEVNRLLRCGDGTIRMVTLAPELPGALAAVAAVVSAGAVAAVGHTDADYATTCAAIDSGATVATHLFNAMPALHHRRPGPVGALVDDPRITVELISDGVHLHPAVASLIERAVGPDRVALVSDAVDAAGMPDGDYLLGAAQLSVSGRVARVADTGVIAGSTSTLLDAFRAAAGSAPGGARLRQAAAMTATTPARVLGLKEVGRLEVGARADLVVLSPDLRLLRVMARGQWVESATFLPH